MSRSTPTGTAQTISTATPGQAHPDCSPPGERPSAGRPASPTIAVRPTPFSKRMLDLIGAGLLLLVLLPLLAGMAVAIKFCSAGPLLFRQSRLGLGGRRFMIWKFRTMYCTASPGRHREYVAQLTRESAPLEKLDNHTDYIPLGRWYRAFGLDELPQLFNVLRGEMSLVGPRPDVLDLEDYEPWQLERFAVAPGITGLWQVSGKNSTTFDTMMRLDIKYVRERSFWMDLEILLRTLPAIVRSALD